MKNKNNNNNNINKNNINNENNKIKFKKEWDLKKYFYSNLEDKNLLEDIKKIKTQSKQIKNKYKGKIKNFKTKDFIEFFNTQEKFSNLTNKVFLYLSLLSSKNTQDKSVLKKIGELEFLMTQISNELLFISQEFKEIGFEKLIKLSKEKELENYSNFFVQKANIIKYILEEKQEFVLNEKENSGSLAFEAMYEELTNSFEYEIEINKKKLKLTRDEITSYIKSPDEKLREKAFNSLKEKFSDKNIQIVLGKVYTSIVKDSVSEIKIRGFKNVMSQRNISEELDDKIVDILIKEVKNSFPLYQRFLKTKAKIMKKTKLNPWDVYAPISKKKEKEIPFEKGLEIFLENIKKFDEEFHKFSKDMFENARVDIFPKKHKTTGAFAIYDKNTPSFVLLNYTNKQNDILTLAHELGHATHGHLMQKQKNEVYRPGFALSETASIFNEILITNSLMKTLNKKEKLNFLEEHLSEIFATIHRQIQYVLFERKVHEKILNGEELTYTDLNILWREEQIKLTGSIVKYNSKPQEEIGWSTIPHIFYTPFYCYTYAFGNILSFALYKQYEKKGKDFIKNYKEILSSGGSKTPYDLLIEHKIDINSKQFYTNGLKIIEEMLKEFELLANER